MKGKMRLILLTLCLLITPASFLASYVAQAQPGETGQLSEGAAAPPPADAVAETVYSVQPGDTLYRISRHTGVSIDDLVATNRLGDPDRITVGQKLRLPAARAGSGADPAAAMPLVRGVAPAQTAESTPNTYVVQRGDTLFKIARRLGVATQLLVELNHISNRALIFPGQTLLVPQAVPDAEQAVAATAPAGALPQGDVTPLAIEDEGMGFLWPVDSRRIVNWYHAWHKGIDIVLATGSDVIASAGGTVLYAGWHDAGYGYAVILDHGNGRRSLYAHNSELLVSTGQEVAQGERIALSGSTGNSTMPHVHLELVIDDRTIDPCGVLPEGC